MTKSYYDLLNENNELKLAYEKQNDIIDALFKSTQRLLQENEKLKEQINRMREFI